MKKTVYSIILLALIALTYSCKVSPEKLAIGTWKLDSVKVLNIDEVANYYFEMDMSSLETELNTVVSQLQSLDPKDKKNANSITQLEEQKKLIEEQKNTFSIESSKDEILQSYNEMLGSAYSFNEDKTYSYKSFEYEEKGTWAISEDGKSINIVSTDNYEFKLLIQELTANKMIITYDNLEEGEITINTVYNFVK
jgi:hypothetical protein